MTENQRFSYLLLIAGCALFGLLLLAYALLKAFVAVCVALAAFFFLALAGSWSVTYRKRLAELGEQP